MANGIYGAWKEPATADPFEEHWKQTCKVIGYEPSAEEKADSRRLYYQLKEDARIMRAEYHARCRKYPRYPGAMTC